MKTAGWKEIVRPYYLRCFYFPLTGRRPEYFDAPWRYPAARLTSADMETTTDAGSATPSFLFLPMSDWHARLQRPQHLAGALAERGHQCYFLNPHMGRQFRSVYALDPAPRAARLQDRITELHVRLPREPVYHQRLLSAAETRMLCHALGHISGARKPVVQILSFPTRGAAALQLRKQHDWPIIYDCHDLLSGFGNIDEAIVAAEEVLLREADHVLFSSVQLQDEHPGVLNRTILRNAVPRAFLRAVEAAPRVRKDRKIVGYFGALDQWFDTDAVRRAAERCPDVDFRLYGRLEAGKVRDLARLPNASLAGEIGYPQLPEVLANFDVGLIPFQLNSLTMAVNPIKLYEYFGAGIPVVSTRLPEVERFAALVYFGGSPGEFADAVVAALREADTARRTARQQKAGAETWDIRAGALADIARGLLLA